MLILTGPSHAGKTSVREALLTEFGETTASLAVDDVLERVLPGLSSERWREIPLAYELIRCQLGVLLDRGWFVVVESTFTYVPPEGPPEFHQEALEGLIEVAASRLAPASIVRLDAARETLVKRARQDARLSPALVSATVEAHAGAAIPEAALHLDTEDLGLAETSRAVSDLLVTIAG